MMRRISMAVLGAVCLLAASTMAAAAAPAVVIATVNVHGKPRVKSPVIGTLRRGVTVNAHSCRRGWCRVGRGWVVRRYLRFKGYGYYDNYYDYWDYAYPYPNLWAPNIYWYGGGYYGRHYYRGHGHYHGRPPHGGSSPRPGPGPRGGGPRSMAGHGTGPHMGHGGGHMGGGGGHMGGGGHGGGGHGGGGHR